MRTTIDFGIDLGTTNSVVAVSEVGQVEVIKNNNNQEITPSVVQLLANGAVIVGRKAYEHLRAHDDGNAYEGAKRQMGKRDQRYPFAAACVSKGPEDLAAEVLKSLRADAEAWAGQSVRAAVITVPAAFELAQAEATQRAALAAGITQAPLLQEPIAAGLAYGYQRDVEDGYFIVYDLGGGTFDVTLLQVRDDRLLVVDHEGHNILGGRDWDRLLCDLIISRLQDQGFEPLGHADPRGVESRRLLRAIAEEEKIRLSRVEQVDIVLDGRVKDAAERPIEGVVTVTRGDFENLIRPSIQQTIDLTRAMLSAQNLDPSTVSRLVLVGGPTLTPLLREIVQTQLEVELETRIDPMTVVARGAALFAASVPLEETSAPRYAPSTALKVQLSYPAVTDDIEAPIGGLLESDGVGGLTIEIRRSDGGWISGRLPVSDGAFVTRVPLATRQANVFEITCYGDLGERVSVYPERVAITQGLAAADPPLSRTISVVAVDEQNEEILVPMLRKGTNLPAVKERSFRTARDLEVGDAGMALNIHVLEGESERTDLNHHVGWLQINGSHIDRPLRAGTPVEVKLKVDTSRGVMATAYIPLLDLTVENVLQDKYRPGIEPELISADLESELRRAQEIGESRPDDLGRIHSSARTVERELATAQAGDPDAADRADLALRELKASVDRLALETEGDRAAAALTFERDAAREIVTEYGDAEAKARLNSLELEAERALGAGDANRTREIAEEFDALYWKVVTEHPGFWVEQFMALADATQHGSRAASAAVLLERGRRALDMQDIGTLRAVCLDLSKMLPREEQPESRLKDIGIRT